MQAVVFADRLGQELAPLTDQTCTALLPILGRPVIEYAIEALARIGMPEIMLVLPPGGEAARQVLGTGERWGVRLNYALSLGEEAPTEFLQRQRLDAEILALRGDVLHVATVKPFLEMAGTLPDTAVYGRLTDGSIALCLSRREDYSLFAPLGWCAPAGGLNLPSVVLTEASVALLDSLRAYHRANLDAAAGRLPGLRTPGRALALGLSVGRGTKISPQSLKQGMAFVGTGCRVHPTAELLQDVVIANHVVIDRYATLRACVVMPDTYVGELVDAHNAILCANSLIRVDTGAVLRTTDIFLLTEFKQRKARLAAPLNRLAGLFLLLGSMPLWPLALLAALMQQPGTLLEVTPRRGNLSQPVAGAAQRRLFNAWEWTTAVPILRYLPWLFAVVAGHLRIVGSYPLTPEQAAARTEDWELLGERAPAGLIGPVPLLLPRTAPIRMRLLSDAFYACQRRLWRDLGYCWQGLKALCSSRAWWPR